MAAVAVRNPIDEKILEFMKTTVPPDRDTTGVTNNQHLDKIKTSPYLGEFVNKNTYRITLRKENGIMETKDISFTNKKDIIQLFFQMVTPWFTSSGEPVKGNPFTEDQRKLFQGILRDREEVSKQQYMSYVSKRENVQKPVSKKRQRLMAYEPAFKMWFHNRDVQHFQDALDNKGGPPYIELRVSRPLKEGDYDKPTKLDSDMKSSIDNYMKHLKQKLLKE